MPKYTTAKRPARAPLNGWVWPHDIHVEGKAEEEGSSGWTRVTPGVFETLGDKIVMRRPISDEDNTNTLPVAVVNEMFAAHCNPPIS